VTNDVANLRPDRAQYNLLCRPDGGIVDDLVVYRAEDAWVIVVNAGNRDKDMAWLREHAAARIEILDRSDELSLIALQGPAAERLLPVEGVDLAGLPYFGTAPGAVAGVRSVISRTGYTGEDGFELFVPSERAGAVWEALVAAGATPCGLAARDVCRLEAGLRLYGSDMDEQTNPFEAGLGWTVKLRKGEFVGREALQQVNSEGPRRVLVGLSGEDRTIPRHGASVTHEGRRIGIVTSGTYSFWLRKGIGMASVDAATPPIGAQVGVGARGDEGHAEVVALPFYRGSVRQAARA
jgi:aminomethyltransferase